MGYVNSGVNDIVVDVKEQLHIAPITKTSDTTVVGTALETAGFDLAVFEVAVGIIADTATLAISITECATSGGSYTAISGASVAAGATAANGSKLHKLPINLKNPARLGFLKASLATAGTTSSTPYSVTAKLYKSATTSVPITQAASVSVVTMV